jgi:hypothetical protein
MTEFIILASLGALITLGAIGLFIWHKVKDNKNKK